LQKTKAFADNADSVIDGPRFTKTARPCRACETGTFSGPPTPNAPVTARPRLLGKKNRASARSAWVNLAEQTRVNFVERHSQELLELKNTRQITLHPARFRIVETK
jgi:hypothetical protein